MTVDMDFVEEADETPETFESDTDVCEYPGCTNPKAEYAGRGRRPRFCDEHKGAKAASKASTSKRVGAPTKEAKQAATVLSQYNGMIAALLMIPNPWLHLPATASAIAAADEGFEEQAARALSTDPKLCRLINKSGSTSGIVGLLMAYGMLGAAVAPVAITEVREKNGNRAAR